MSVDWLYDVPVFSGYGFAFKPVLPSNFLNIGCTAKSTFNDAGPVVQALPVLQTI
jgi:hypothetical protein